MRLNRFLAQAGVDSRRKCDLLIQQGRVSVNGVPVTQLGVRIDPDRDQIGVDGQPVRVGERLTYILLNKPAGYIVTAQDTHHRKTVFDLLGGIPQRVFPVGRLDFDTEGVLLLINDGDLAFRLSHPRYQVPKTYLALVEGMPAKEALERLSRGVRVDNWVSSPAQVRLVKVTAGDALVEIELQEGRKRQVKKMCQTVGHRVKKLWRTAFAGIQVADLPPGRWRPLRQSEVRKLRTLVGLNPNLKNLE